MTEHIALLADTATALFTDHCGPETVDAGWSGRLWEVIEDAELSLISVPESADGAGGGTEEAAALLRVAGRFCAPVPLAETMLAGWLLAAAGLPLPPGPLAVAVVEESLLRRDGSDWRLAGRLHRVGWARNARRLVLLAGTVVVAVDTGRLTIVAGANMAGEPRDRVDIDGVSATHVGELEPEIASQLRLRAALGRAALMSGAAERALELTIRYVGERVQFGRPLARFQAVQQHLATMAGEVTATGVASGAAARAMQRRAAAATLEVGSAKLRAGEAAGCVAALAHQLHGAIGVTDEHVLRHSTTRLWSWREEDGNERFWGEQIGKEVLAGGSGALWPRLTLSS